MSSETTAGSALEPVAGIKDGVIGTLSAFGNIPEAAPRLRMRWFWIYPFIVFAAVTEVVQIVTADQRAHITQVMMEHRGLSSEQIQNQLAMAAKFAPVGWIVTPIFILGFMALSAALIGAIASVVGAKGRFSQFLGLNAAGTMPIVLQMIIGLFFVRSKPIDEFQSMADLQPPFGLNILVDNAPKMLQALLGFFSIFEIWAIVVTALMFAAMCRTSVGKGFAATSPAWIIGALLTMVGALFT